MINHDDEEITAIIYDAETNLPHTVFTRSAPTIHGPGRCLGIYDFDWCAKDEKLAYHCSGSGGRLYINQHSPGSMKIWVKPGEVVHRDCGKRCVKVKLRDGKYPEPWRAPKRVKARAMRRWGHTPIAHPIQRAGNSNPFTWLETEEGRAEWCAECGCHRFVDSDRPCPHLIWCDECSDFSKPGKDTETLDCGHPSEP